MMKKVVVTTSWDDGHKLDLKVSELMQKYNLEGTFYVSPKDREISPEERLTDSELIELSQKFEIGAHTMTHPIITKADDVLVKKEIADSKEYLEKVLNKKIEGFCYPGGYFDKRHKELIKNLGFRFARTVSRFSKDIGSDVFELPTTVHAYRHWSDAWKILREVGLYRFLKSYYHWDELAIILFDKTMKEGGVYHLWGHSWEIDKNKDWQRLERVFKYISGRDNVVYTTNSNLI